MREGGTGDSKREGGDREKGGVSGVECAGGRIGEKEVEEIGTSEERESLVGDEEEFITNTESDRKPVKVV